MPYLLMQANPEFQQHPKFKATPGILDTFIFSGLQNFLDFLRHFLETYCMWNKEPSKRLFVGNLPLVADLETLKAALGQGVELVHWILDRKTQLWCSANNLPTHVPMTTQRNQQVQ
eukprot:704838-Amphidinium_carterae.1